MKKIISILILSILTFIIPTSWNISHASNIVVSNLDESIHSSGFDITKNSYNFKNASSPDNIDGKCAGMSMSAILAYCGILTPGEYYNINDYIAEYGNPAYILSSEDYDTILSNNLYNLQNNKDIERMLTFWQKTTNQAGSDIFDKKEFWIKRQSTDTNYLQNDDIEYLKKLIDNRFPAYISVGNQLKLKIRDEKGVLTDDKKYVGHAIVAYAYSENIKDGTLTLKVYDSNFPYTADNKYWNRNMVIKCVKGTDGKPLKWLYLYESGLEGNLVYDSTSCKFYGQLLKNGESETIENRELQVFKLDLYMQTLKYSSLPSTWAVEEIKSALKSKIVTGKVLNNFSKPITREEFTELILKLYEAARGNNNKQKIVNPFIDTFNKEIIKAANLGLVNGTSSTLFSPEREISRQEIAVILIRTLKKIGLFNDVVVAPVEFNDNKEIASWAMDDIFLAYQLGIISGTGDDKISPTEEASREQAIALVNRAYNKFINKN